MIDLKQFCGKGDYREILNAPFSDSEFTYASNGHIIVRVPRRSDIEPLSGGSFLPSAQKKFGENKPGELIAIPTLPPLKMIPCDECEHGCAYCENGFVPKMQWVELGDTQFMNHYLHLVVSLPNALISPNGKNAAPFTFDGGDGLLMPCKKF